jgi:hypothetical protein
MFVPNSLTVYRRFFSSEDCACDIFLSGSVFPPPVFFLCCGDHYPFATNAPFLKSAHPERHPGRVTVNPSVQNQNFTVICRYHLRVGGGAAKLSRVPVLPHIRLFLRLNMIIGSSTVSEVVDLSTTSSSWLFITRQTVWLFASKTLVQWFSRRPRYSFQYFPVVAAVFCSVLRCVWCFSSLSSYVAAPQHLDSLRPCCNFGFGW